MLTDIRQQALAGLKAGDTFSVTRTFTEADTLAFGGVSREYNPAHYSDAFVDVKQLEGPICHGLAVGGRITAVGCQIGWLASGMNFRFQRRVYLGDTVTCAFTIREGDDRRRAKADAVLSNQYGDTVIQAWLTGVLPSEAERQVMRSEERRVGKECRAGGVPENTQRE